MSDGFDAFLGCSPQTHYYASVDAFSTILAQLLRLSYRWLQFVQRTASQRLCSNLHANHQEDTGKTLGYHVGSYC